MYFLRLKTRIDNYRNSFVILDIRKNKERTNGVAWRVREDGPRYIVLFEVGSSGGSPVSFIGN